MLARNLLSTEEESRVVTRLLLQLSWGLGKNHGFVNSAAHFTTFCIGLNALIFWILSIPRIFSLLDFMMNWRDATSRFRSIDTQFIIIAGPITPFRINYNVINFVITQLIRVKHQPCYLERDNWNERRIPFRSSGPLHAIIIIKSIVI